ncbi:hypothetical protein N0V90_001507 [Kalmusia sp. IMI 367209]|nr:hypothetical protein N0V90_001507 [Kalmusia sp. IMI 367209]
MSSHSNILIVGAGIFGTSTAYHLSLTANPGTSITVLDRSPYPPHHAASTDINKIVRADYSTPFYMDLAYEALHAWKTLPILQSKDGPRFFHESGWVTLSDEGSDLADRIRGNLRLLLGENGVKGVRTKDGRVYEAEKVLLATGAWTSQLLSPVEDSLDVPEDDRIEKQVTAAGVCVVHYKLSEEEYERFKDMPVIVYGDRGEVLPPPNSNRLLKFTNARSFSNTTRTPSGRRISIPPHAPQTTVPARLQSETLDSIVSKTMPSFAARKPDSWRLCWDAITPTQDQLITPHPHPRLGNVYLAVGGSFHSWKFLPNIGAYVVNALNGVSNGAEKDRRWAWKKGHVEGRGAHEKVVPSRGLSELED